MSDRIEREVGGRTLVVAHGPGQSAMAQDLMHGILRATGGRAPPPGSTIRVGFGLLTLVADEDAEGRMLLCEPDYLGDPFVATRPRVDVTLAVLGLQSRLAHAVGMAPAEIGFEQFLVVARGALAADAIQLMRAEPTAPDDSGWCVDRLASAAAPDDYDAVRVYELVRVRTILIAPLILPIDSVSVIQGDAIVAVYDPRGYQLLSCPFRAGDLDGVR